MFVFLDCVHIRLKIVCLFLLEESNIVGLVADLVSIFWMTVPRNIPNKYDLFDLSPTCCLCFEKYTDKVEAAGLAAP